MLLRTIAKTFPTSRLGQRCDEIYKLELGDRMIAKGFYYGIIGSFAGATYGACTNKGWKMDMESRVEGALGGAVCGTFAGAFYPVTTVIGAGVAMSYVYDVFNRFEIAYKR